MTLAYPVIDSSPQPALRVSRRLVDRADALSDEAAADRTAPTLPAFGATSEAEREQLYLIDMRYQQHLAQHALQELFESGALGNLES